MWNLRWVRWSSSHYLPLLACNTLQLFAPHSCICITNTFSPMWLFFMNCLTDPEHESTTVLQNIKHYLLIDTVLYPRRLECSVSELLLDAVCSSTITLDMWCRYKWPQSLDCRSCGGLKRHSALTLVVIYVSFSYHPGFPSTCHLH